MKSGTLAIVGGLGKVGMQIALELREVFESFLFIDSKEATAERISFLEKSLEKRYQIKIVDANEIDVSETTQIAKWLKEYNVDVCVGAVPSFMQYQVAEAAAMYGNCHYFDLGASQESLNRQKGLNEIFRKNQKIQMPFCGFDPGMLNVLLLSCVKHIDCDEIRVYVGGIAENKPKNQFAHYWTFNPESTLETYCGSVSAIQKGMLVTKEALEGYVNINIDTRPYEAFFTNCGNKEVMEKISQTAPHIKTCEIKTVRHLGHWDMVHFLTENDLLRSTSAMFPIVVERLEASVPYAERDIAFLEMRFFKDGEKQGVISWREEGSRETTTAMQKATAKSAALTITCALEYAPHEPLSGFMMPERIFTSKLLDLHPKKIIEKMRWAGLSISTSL